jgi:hypothetical protein
VAEKQLPHIPTGLVPVDEGLGTSRRSRQTALPPGATNRSSAWHPAPYLGPANAIVRPV